MTTIHVSVPIRTSAGQNAREHFGTRARRVKAEREAVAWMLKGYTPPAGPVKVLMVRVSPGRPLDAHDNLPGSLKAPVDAVAEWLGRDDADPSIDWSYGQRPGKQGKRGNLGEWAVEIHVMATA